MSTLKADTIQSTSGGAATLTKQYATKMWVNLEQVTPAARDSLNVSSLTDVGTGKTNVVMTNAMSDGNYSGSFFTNAFNGTDQYHFDNNFAGGFGNSAATGGRTTTTIVTASYGASYVDASQVDVTAIGDLA